MTPAAPATAAKPTRRWRPWLTIALIAANCAVFAAVIASVGSLPLEYLALGQLNVPGSVDGISVWLDHEWWRTFTAMFVHANGLHIAANMWALWNVGFLTERLYGRAFTLFAYLLTGVCGACFSMLVHPSLPSVGASGAIFGLFGLICGFTVRARHLMDPEVFARLRTGILLSLGMNVVLTIALPMIDVAAHLGGLISGTAVGLLATGSTIEKPGQRPAFASQLIVVAAVIAAALLSRTHTLHSTEGRSWERTRLARSAARAERWDDMVAAATDAIHSKDEPESRRLRGEAYAKLGRWPEALADFSRAQELTSLDSPTLPSILERKANAELHTGQTDEAKSDLARASDLVEDGATWIEAHGQLNIVEGNYELAILELRAARKRSPEEPGVANSLAWALVMTQGDLDEALQAANFAVERAKGSVLLKEPKLDIASLGTRCWVLALRDEKDRAMADCQVASESGSPVDAGMLAYLKGDYAAAIQQWQQAGVESPLEAREMKPWIERAKTKLAPGG